MASEIRVDRITHTAGVGTITPSPTGVHIAGIVTGTTFSGSGASLTNLPAAQVTGTLPAISGANLTNLTATNLTGTIADARFPATLPAASAANLTSIPAANLVGVCTSGLTKTGGFGKILQVVSTTKKDTFSTSNNDHTEITGLNASITKTIASSKILIMVDIGFGRSGRDSTEFKLYEDSSELTAAHSTGASSDNCFIVDYNHLTDTTSETYSWYNASKTVLIDGQNDTSSHTYKVYGHSNAATLYINRRAYSTSEFSTSSITLIEIAV